ncbi:hypothetical protein EHF33_13750 [Deinococcus psychrotolerans]|uniref:Uncharacterized protein n=1 Tax=Deinococcus psychrotolerans TaxID=2489213 RepID=A0A3G8YFC7_9DEIO|nr:hypothetical protein [Deinococcus psychrotolerans]AZI43988.1 hypothetical protein EHF33_13750 [Deinococcus psychrotolerans]
MKPKRTRTPLDLTATIASAAQHLSLKSELRRTHGQNAHSFVITSTAQLSVYDAAGQEVWPARNVPDDQLLALAQDAAALHGFGHWLLDDATDQQPNGEWRAISNPPLLNLPW